jgi:hypothetical protein
VAGKLTIRVRKHKHRVEVTLGTFNGRLAGGAGGTLTFRVTRNGLKRLRHAKRHTLKVHAVGTTKNQEGARFTVKGTVKLTLAT